METLEALGIVKSLAAGKDPATGNGLPPESLFQQPDILRALFCASLALGDYAQRERRRSLLPENTGKAWSSGDDARLTSGFDAGLSIKLLAADLRRSLMSVRLRLIKLGKIDEATDLAGYGG